MLPHNQGCGRRRLTSRRRHTCHHQLRSKPLKDFHEGSGRVTGQEAPIGRPGTRTALGNSTWQCYVATALHDTHTRVIYRRTLHTQKNTAPSGKQYLSWPAGHRSAGCSENLTRYCLRVRHMPLAHVSRGTCARRSKNSHIRAPEDVETIGGVAPGRSVEGGVRCGAGGAELLPVVALPREKLGNPEKNRKECMGWQARAAFWDQSSCCSAYSPPRRTLN